jgi:hypothetical protein
MSSNLAANTLVTQDFVFRTADRMRIEGCTNAITREGLSLSLQCEHEALLDHYMSLLLKRLRQESPGHHIEVYFPSNTDSLLGRFNEALARQSVNQATQAPTDASRPQIWIVHDAQALPEAEIQLLARLIQNFPGANIRAILLMSGANASNNLSAFGRKILRWDIEAPNAEQAQAAMDTARADGYLLSVQQLLNRIHRKGLQEPSAAPLDAASFANPAPVQPEASGRHHQVKQHVIAFHEKGQQALKQSTRVFGKWRRNHTFVALSIAAALALSTLAMLWLQPEAFGIQVGAKAPAPKPLPIEGPASGNSPAQAPPPAPVAPTAQNNLR